MTTRDPRPTAPASSDASSDTPPATDRVSYDEWSESEDLAGLHEWNEMLDSDEEFYCGSGDEGADYFGTIDIAELNDLDDSLASDD